MSDWPLRRMLGTVFGVIGVVTAVVVAVVVTAIVRLDSARSDRVERYGPALLATETLSKAYSDQETGVRGYVSSAERTFLAPYTQGLAAEREQEKVLRRLLADRPDLQRRLRSVVEAAQVWQQTVAEPAIALTMSRGAGATGTEAVVAGKERFDAVRAALRRLQAPVRVSRDEASRTLGSSLNVLRVVLVLALLLLLAFGVGSWHALQRWVTNPMRRLGSEVGRVEGGDLRHAVVVSAAPADIRVLAEQVDRMRGRIVRELRLADQARDDAQHARDLVEEQADELRRSNAELEQFAYVASHDLQEPLRKVASFCQLLERRYHGQLDDRGEQYIEFAVDGAKRMQRLINDLLAFSRVGRLGAPLTPVDLGDALAQAQRQVAASLEEASAVITHDDLPTVEGDSSLLVQLFQNLIGNGVKFRREDAPRIHVGARRGAETWELWCADNGIGIEAQYAEKIFVIFQRLHGRDVYGGTGIGLAMCRKIVEYHGGRMWLDTTGAGGTTFRWTLPVLASEKERTSDDPVTAGAPD